MKKFELNDIFCSGDYEVVKITEKCVFFKEWDAIKEEWNVIRRKKHVQYTLNGTPAFEYAIIHKETDFRLNAR